MLLLLLHKPQKAVGTFRASTWYEQSCICYIISCFDTDNFCIETSKQSNKIVANMFECIFVPNFDA